ncbi:MAG: DHH family phosphoesterase [Desulfovibrio sp.]|nr:DHH family phosphoesterase [Desulfovibrio sp.]
MSWRILPEILSDSRVFIQTHDFPDPDAIASAYGLQYLLRQCGIEATLCYRGSLERAFLTHIIETYHIELLEQAQIQAMRPEDKIVLVDGQKFNANMVDLPGDEVACIDHHPTFTPCEYRYKDVRQVGACSSIIAEYFLSDNVPMTVELATLLLFGLRVDTDNMTRGVTDLDLNVFPFLYRQADQNMLAHLAAKNLEFSDLKAFGAAIGNIRVYNHVGFVSIPFDCHDSLIAQVANFILSLAEVDIAIIWSWRSGGLKFSVRNVLKSIHSGNMLATVLADVGSGGGHASMAGGFIPTGNLQLLGQSHSVQETALVDKFLHYIHQHTLLASGSK